MELEVFKSIIEVATSLSLLVAGGWAVLQYRRSRRASAAQWLAKFFEDFYVQKRLSNARTRFEDKYDSEIAKSVQEWVSGVKPNGRGRNWELEAEQDFDLFLNYLEMISRLTNHSEVSTSDFEALFDYWLGELGNRTRPEIGLYISEFGYENLRKVINTKQKAERQLSADCLYGAKSPQRKGWNSGDPLENKALFAVYGSLRKDSDQWNDFSEWAEEQQEEALTLEFIYLSKGSVSGRLVDVDGYPAMLKLKSSESDQRVDVEILDVSKSPDAIYLIDEWEEYDPRVSPRRGYYREFVSVTLNCEHSCQVGAWVYRWRAERFSD